MHKTMILSSSHCKIWGNKRATTPETRMVNNNKTKNNYTCCNLDHSSVIMGLSQNTWSPARTNIHDLCSAKNLFIAVSSHPLMVSYSSMSLPVSQSPLRPRGKQQHRGSQLFPEQLLCLNLVLS